MSPFNIQQKLFNAGAKLYDSATSNDVWTEHCRRLSPGDRSFSSILDLGCGPGISTFELEDLHPEADVIGLDIAPGMIKRARAKQQERNSDANFFLGNAESLPFQAGQFDFVTGHSFLYLLENRKQALRDIARILEPNGQVAFLEPRKNPGFSWILPSYRKGFRVFKTMVGWQVFSFFFGRFDRDSLVNLLESCGLVDPEIEVTLNGLGWMVRARKP